MTDFQSEQLYYNRSGDRTSSTEVLWLYHCTTAHKSFKARFSLHGQKRNTFRGKNFHNSPMHFFFFLDLINAKTVNDYYVMVTFLMFSLKGLIQASIVHYLSRRYVLWHFIENLNSFLTDIKTCSSVQKHERDFKRASYRGLGLCNLY